MNSYSTSDGKRLKQCTIKHNIRLAKQEKLRTFYEKHGYFFCEDCGRNENNTRIDCSHEISVGKSKQDGKVELAFDVDNIKLRCRECHEKHDNL